MPLLPLGNGHGMDVVNSSVTEGPTCGNDKIVYIMNILCARARHTRGPVQHTIHISAHLLKVVPQILHFVQLTEKKVGHLKGDIPSSMGSTCQGASCITPARAITLG